MCGEEREVRDIMAVTELREEPGGAAPWPFFFFLLFEATGRGAGFVFRPMVDLSDTYCFLTGPL